MRGIKALLMIPVAGTLLLAAGCTGNILDDGDSADVILSVSGFTTPPITAAVSTTGFCSTTTTNPCTEDIDCPGLEICIIGGCTLTVVDWAFTMANDPKNALATAPTNNIAMIDVTIAYVGLAPAVAPATFGLGGLVIPVDGSSPVIFPPMRLQDLAAGHEGTTAQLFLTFQAMTLEGTPITMTVGRDLAVEVCL